MQSKIRVGILYNEFHEFRNWELRIFKALIDSEWAEIVLMIQDGREVSLKNRLTKIVKGSNILGKIFFKIISNFESIIFREKVIADKSKVLHFLGNLEKIDMYPQRKGSVDFFEKEQCVGLKKYRLDILLRHGFNIIKGEMLNVPKNGIWSFHHADNEVNRGMPAGFWEIVLKQPVTGVTLQRLTPELDGGLVIDKGFYSTQHSFFKNNSFIFEKSVTLLLKNLKLLYDFGHVQYTPSKVYSFRLYKTPNLFWLLKYEFLFWSSIFKTFNYHASVALGFRPRAWSIFIGRGNFLNSTLFRTKEIKPSNGEFWADPS